MNRIFLYCLGLAAAEHGVVMHCAALMSTHYHLVVTDVRGEYPLFTKRMNRLMANATNVLRKWSGEAFNASGPNMVVLNTNEAVVDKCGYTIANPVAAGAVRYARDWPGVVTRVQEMGRRVFVFDRPRHYFDPDGDLPERIELRFELPKELIDERRPPGALRALPRHHRLRERGDPLSMRPVDRRGGRRLRRRDRGMQRRWRSDAPLPGRSLRRRAPMRERLYRRRGPPLVSPEGTRG